MMWWQSWGDLFVLWLPWHQAVLKHLVHVNKKSLGKCPLIHTYLLFAFRLSFVHPFTRFVQSLRLLEFWKRIFKVLKFLENQMKQGTVLESSGVLKTHFPGVEIPWKSDETRQSWRVLEFWKHFFRVLKFLENQVIQGTVLEGLGEIEVVVLTVLDLECLVLCMLLSHVFWTSVWLKKRTFPDSFMLSFPVLVIPALSQSSNKHVCSFFKNKF